MPWTVYQMRVESEVLPFYIGCTSRTSYRRWIEHKHRASIGKENSERGRIIRAAQNAGLKIIIEDLELYDDMAEAHGREIFWIEHYGRQPQGPLVNDEPGGYGVGKTITVSARQKMSEAKLGNTINVGRARPDFRENTRKDVTAFTGEGKRIASYETARLASEDTGVHWKTISEIVRGKITSTRSRGIIYQFRFGIIEHDIAPCSYRSQSIRRTK